jgi:ribosomal-protein-alanine N-acetyltransferase
VGDVIMIKADIGPLTQEHAEEIADEWKYPDEYSFYDMTADVEDYEEIIDPQKRKDSYFQIVEDGQLIGFFALTQSCNSMELGLGMKPELCGRGMGMVFMRKIEDFIMQSYDVDMLTLSVAEFNKRAVSLYHDMGYVDCSTEIVDTNGGRYSFINMVKRMS